MTSSLSRGIMGTLKTRIIGGSRNDGGRGVDAFSKIQ